LPKEKKMKNFFAGLGLIGFLFCSPAAANDGVTKQDLLHSIEPVEKAAVVWTARVVDDDKLLGTVVLYDDPATERPVDYLELYNSDGDLLAFGWFDRFGIERIAVDNGFLYSSQKPEGTFFVLVDGQEI